MTTGSMGCSSSSSATAEEGSSAHPNTPVQYQQQQQQGQRVAKAKLANGGLTPVAEIVPLEVITAKVSETICQAYQRLDEEICALESTCPGPRLLTAEAWVEHLRNFVGELFELPQDGVERFVMDARMEDIPNGIPEDSRDSGGGGMAMGGTLEQMSQRAKDDMAKLALKMDIALDPVKAARQEEFLARVSRSAMQLEAAAFRVDMVDHASLRAASLRQNFNQLKTLYLELDYLIVTANNGSYSSLHEQRLDGELESAREIRDRLGGVSEQWRTAGSLLRVSAQGMQRAVEYWNLVVHSRKAPEKIALAVDCRTACHGALIALEAAHAALPQVEIPFVTVRQQSAVKHGLVYMLTDMANPARCEHTKHVLEGFLANVHKSVEWIHDTYRDTLQKDLSEADQSVMMVAKQLREIRKQYLYQRMPSKVYVKPTLGKLQQQQQQLLPR